MTADPPIFAVGLAPDRIVASFTRQEWAAGLARDLGRESGRPYRVFTMEWDGEALAWKFGASTAGRPEGSVV